MLKVQERQYLKNRNMCPSDWGPLVTACVNASCSVCRGAGTSVALRSAHVLSTNSSWEPCLFSLQCRCMCLRWWHWPLWWCGRLSSRCNLGERTPAAPRPCTSWNRSRTLGDAQWNHTVVSLRVGGWYSLYLAPLRCYFLSTTKSEPLALDNQLVFGPWGCRGGSNSGERKF